MNPKEPVFRGEVYFATLEPAVGSEQGGTRPVIIVQNDIGNRHSPVTIAVPTTSKMTKHNLPTHVLLPLGATGLPEPSIALCEQIRVLSKTRLLSRVGKLPDSIMEQVNKAIKSSLELN